MHDEARKRVFAGCIAGTLAVAAYVSQAGRPWLSADEPGIERSDASAYRTRGDVISGSVSAGPAVADNHADAAAARIQAARTSLQRNDVVAAQKQLDAVPSAHRNDAQVLSLQKEVAVRGQSAQRATTDVGRKRNGSGAAQGASRTANRAAKPDGAYAATRHGRSRGGNQPAVREVSGRTSTVAKNRSEPSTVATATNQWSMKSAGMSAGLTASAPASTPAPMKVVSREANAPAASNGPAVTNSPAPVETTGSRNQSTLTAQASPAPSIAPAPSQLSQLAQNDPAGGTAVRTDGGPKTRAQVRAEIVRARSDGSLPAFGNPNPAGPGGAPSLVIPSRP
ncbi:hypothetical protein P3T18_003294 [Paraburkholderia sp. GAS199]|uniref:hypothetical protein n=1 Tax=Paraburkholderia sp. GAS199 TaxID=3035126 RepID=UPI003D20695D